MTYLQLDLEINPSQLIEEMRERMADQFPTWTAAAGVFEDALFGTLVLVLGAPLARMTVNVPDAILEKFGEGLFNVPPIAASKATATSTWKFDTEGPFTIRDGTQVDFPLDSDTNVGFVVVGDVTIPAGSSETTAGEVLLEAIDAGVAPNGLGADAELVDALQHFESLAIVGTASGGADAEEAAVYLSRLTETLKTQSPRPVIARDVAILLRSIPGVQRVGVLDNYNLDTEEDEQEKTLSYVPLDSAGLGVGPTVLEECQELLEATREANFIFVGGAPDYTKVNVNFQVVARAGFSQAEADAATAAALTLALSPARFGLEPGLADSEPTTWLVTDKIRYQDLVTIVNNVPAVDHYTVLKVAKEGSGLGVVDVTLPGDAPLPKPGTIQVGS